MKNPQNQKLKIKEDIKRIKFIISKMKFQSIINSVMIIFQKRLILGVLNQHITGLMILFLIVMVDSLPPIRKGKKTMKIIYLK